MDMNTAQKVRYGGTVAVWFSSHYQIDTRDWDNIEEFHGDHHPLLGYYRSDDPKVLRQQLHWMRRAGIDLIVYDVFSTGKWDLTDLAKDRTLPLLVDELAHQEGQPRKLQLAIWLEKYLGNPTVEQYRYALDYVRRNLAPHDFYFRYAGKPLVVAYLNGRNNAIYQIEWENSFFSLHRIRPYYSDVWAYIDHSPQRLNRDWMPASPGFDPYLENAYIAAHVRKEKNPDLAAIRRDSRQQAADRVNGGFFEQQLLRVREGNPNIVFISGWNDWQYACQIEPAVEYGFRYVDMAASLLGRELETSPYRQDQRTVVS